MTSSRLLLAPLLAWPALLMVPRRPGLLVGLFLLRPRACTGQSGDPEHGPSQPPAAWAHMSVKMALRPHGTRRCMHGGGVGVPISEDKIMMRGML